MAHLKTLAGVAGIVLLLLPCIFAGMYAEPLNTSIAFAAFGMSGTLAALGVGLGVALAEISIILLLLGKKAGRYLKSAEIPEEWRLHRLRNSLEVMSRKRLRLIAMLIVGILPSAYWIARPLYILRIFQEHLPEYLALGSATSPESAAGGDAAEQPPLDTNGEDDAPEQPQPGDKHKDSSGRAPIAEERSVPPKPVVPSNSPVRGKIMPVDIYRRAIDPVFFDLSRDFRPTRPDDVGAIAALWWWEEQVGQYGSVDSNAGAALKQHCTVMVWDKLTKSLLAERSFVGGEPPRTSRSGQRRSGSRPYAEIRDFLNSLPHQ